MLVMLNVVTIKAIHAPLIQAIEILCFDLDFGLPQCWNGDIND